MNDIYGAPKSKIVIERESLTSGPYSQLRRVSIKAIFFFLVVILFIIANVYIDGYFEGVALKARDIRLLLYLLIPTVLALILAVGMKIVVRKNYLELFVKTLNIIHWLIPGLLLAFVLFVRIAPLVK